jgi:outer membrane protein assembly factor BamB
MPNKKRYMKLLMLLYCSILLIGQQACKKPAPIKEPSPIPSSKYYSDTIVPIMWESPLVSTNPFLDTKEIYFQNQKIFSAQNSRISSYNPTSGSLFQSNLFSNLGDVIQFFMFDKLYIRGRIKNGLYDLANFNKIVEFNEVQTFTSFNDYSIINYAGNLLHMYSDNVDSSVTVAKFINGQDKILYKDSLLWKNNYVAGLATFFWIKPNGDSCLVLSPSLLERQGGNANHTAVCIYNLNTKQVEWSLIDFDYSGLGGALAVKDNKFYCNGPRHLYCYDLITHQKLWEYDFRNEDPAYGGFSYFDNSPLFFDNDKIYIHSSGAWGYCFNRNNGQTIWKTEAGKGPGNKVEYNGIIYFRGSQFDKKTGGSSANIVGIRKIDGKVVFSSRSPEAIRTSSNSSTEWNCNSIALDTSKGWLFALTPNQMVCLDISKIQ